MATWAAAILVGGRARRLQGVTKPLLDVAGQSILARQVDVLARLGVVPLLVTSDPTPFAPFGLRVVPDAVGTGALAGLYTALLEADAAATHVLVLAGDLPFVTAPFLAALLAQREGVDAVVPRTEGRWHPMCAVYARSVAPRAAVRLARSELRVTDFLTELRIAAVAADVLAAFDPDGRLLLNVNTPDDYERAARLATLET